MRIGEAIPRTVPLEKETSSSSEFGMRVLLTTLIALFVVQDVFDLQLSLGPGLSAKNALLYVIAGALAFKITMQHSFTLELRALHACFVVMITYAILSYLAAKFVVDYQHYNLVASGIRLKATLLDRAIFFLVFFHALRDSKNAFAILKILLLAVALAHLIALLNGLGLMQTGEMGANEKDRVQGLMGEPNQDAAFGALFLAALGVAVASAKGLRRLPWIIGLGSMLAAILMTASRGGFVAIVLAGIWACVFLRRYIPLQRLFLIGLGGAVLCAGALAAVMPFYGDLLYDRVFGDSSTGDIATASSGRTEIWSTAIATMADAPITFVTGFGWHVYSLMPFRYAPHNYYLDLWFNLGLAGLISGTMMLVLVVRGSLRAVPVAKPEYRPHLMAFAVGVVAVAIATFFVDLYTPWLWFWAYAGLVLRIAVNARREQRASNTSKREVTRVDAFGWTGHQRAGSGELA